MNQVASIASPAMTAKTADICSTPLLLFTLTGIAPAGPEQKRDGRDNKRGARPIKYPHHTTPVAMEP